MDFFKSGNFLFAKMYIILAYMDVLNLYGKKTFN